MWRAKDKKGHIIILMPVPGRRIIPFRMLTKEWFFLSQIRDVTVRHI
jgi:hypothetical protein